MLFLPILASWAYAGAPLLKDGMTESQARAALAPALSNLKTLEAADMETIIANQWFPFAHEIIVKSHEQGADLSFAVRKGVQKLKNQADELVRALNPKYGITQTVNPSFMWAQNETSIFLTVKFSARWNAPGALEVSDAVVNFTRSKAYFTGLGQHSNIKFKYVLDLNVFDALLPEACIWSTSSVGKLSITLRKKWPRKWPRLLADKKMKISNMLVWMEYQENFKMDDVYTAVESPLSCAHTKKFYCLSTDKCVEGDKCADGCKADNQPVEDTCVGKPGSEGKVSFTDSNLQEGLIAGTFTLSTVEKTAFDIDEFELYWSNAEGTERKGLIGTVAHTQGEKPTIALADQKPEHTHVLVVAKNAKGELAAKKAEEVKDAYLPRNGPVAVTFSDTDGQADWVAGDLQIMLPDAPTFTSATAHWARSKTKRISGPDSLITTKDLPAPPADKDKEDAAKAAEDARSMKITISRQKIGGGGKYIHVYGKNEFGESIDFAVVKIEDAARPCAYGVDDTEDCLKEGSVKVSEDTDDEENQVTFSVEIPAVTSVNVTDYAFYFGEGSCSQGRGHKVGAKLGSFDGNLPEGTPSWTKKFENVKMPMEAISVLVYPTNKHGESSNCVSGDLFDASSKFDFGRRRYAKVTASMATKSSAKKEMFEMLKKDFAYDGAQSFEPVRKFLEETVLPDAEKNALLTEKMQKLNEDHQAKMAKKDEKKKKKEEKKKKKKGSKEEL